MNMRSNVSASQRNGLDTLLAMDLPWPLRLAWYLCLSSSFGLLLAWLAGNWQPAAVPVVAPSPEPPAMPSLPSAPAPVSIPAGAPPALPVKPSAPPAAALGQALKVQGFGALSPAPAALELDWQAAAEHCAAQGLRLPTVPALQALWLQHTQGRPSNAELCSRAGWPLARLCGGSTTQAEYWSRDRQAGYPQAVNLFNGLARARHAEAPLQLACVDEGGAP